MPPLKMIIDKSRDLRRWCVDTHLLAGLVVALEFHYAVDFGKERIVAALSHIRAGMELRPALPDNDRSRVDRLAVIPFHTEVLGLAVSSVS